MTKATMSAGPFGEIAVHESEGVERPIVLVHGNSSSARAFRARSKARSALRTVSSRST